jgi:hypothetical protein
VPSLNLGDLEEVDYDPFKRKGLDQFAPPVDPGDRTAEIRAGGAGTLSPGNPSWGDRLAGGFSDTMGLLGATPTGQKNAFEFGQNLTSVIPGVSNVVSGNQAYRDFSGGNIAGGLLNTAAALPIPGAGMLERAGGKVVAKEAAHDFPGMLSKLGEDWKNAPVINQAGDFVHGGVDMDALNQNLALLNDEGNLSKGILAYHGTPHEFNKFDASKIGSGEGAQMYGHGLYFAEHPEVAEEYRIAGTQDSGKLFNPQGDEVYLPVNNKDPKNLAHQYVKYGGSFEKGHELIDLAQGESDIADTAHAHLDEMEKSGWTVQGPGEGLKYQVAIKHDPDTFFDLDKKFGDQHPDVQSAVNDIYGRKLYKGLSGQRVHDLLYDKIDREPGIEDTPATLSKRLREAGVPGARYFDEGSRNPFQISEGIGFNPNVKLRDHPQSVQDKVMKLVPDADPGDLMDDVHKKLHGNLMRESASGWDHSYGEDATNALLKAGVPAWEAPKTRNYVTFDDNNVKILKRLGAAGALTLGGTGSALANPWKHKDLNSFQLDHEDDDGQ